MVDSLCCPCPAAQALQGGFPAETSQLLWKRLPDTQTPSSAFRRTHKERIWLPRPPSTAPSCQILLDCLGLLIIDQSPPSPPRGSSQGSAALGSICRNTVGKSHPIPSHVLGHKRNLILSHSTPFHSTLFHPIPSHPIPIPNFRAQGQIAPLPAPSYSIF